MSGMLSKLWNVLGYGNNESPAPKKAVPVFIYTKCEVTMKTVISVRSSDMKIYAFEYNDKDVRFSYHRCECNIMKTEEYEKLLKDIEEADRRRVEMDREQEKKESEGSESGDEEVSDGAESEQSEDSEDSEDDGSSEAGSDLEDSGESENPVVEDLDSVESVSSGTEGDQQEQIQINKTDDSDVKGSVKDTVKSKDTKAAENLRQDSRTNRIKFYESDSEDGCFYLFDSDYDDFIDLSNRKPKRSYQNHRTMAYRPTHAEYFGQNKKDMMPADDGCDDRDFISSEVQKSWEEEVITSNPIHREKFFVHGREADDLDYAIRDYKEMLARKKQEQEEALDAHLASSIEMLEEFKAMNREEVMEKLEVETEVAQPTSFAEKFRNFMDEVHEENQKRNQQLLDILKTFEKN